ncbi:MAG: hypothetical protein ABSB19_20815 [Methylomonas sp.]
MTVTKEQLDKALDAWAEARNNVDLEWTAWGRILQSYNALIASLRTNGHTLVQAKEQFDAISNAHRDAIAEKWKNMDKLCHEYRMLLDEFSAK